MNLFRARIGALLALFLALGAGTAHGAAFALFEQGAAAIGRGGAYVAGANDPSALFYNPAALAGIPGTQIYAAPSLIFFDDSYAGEPPYPGYGATGETAAEKFLIPAFYASHELAKGLTAAAGVSAPFGLQTDWTASPQFAGRFLSQLARVEQVDGNAALAAEVCPGFRLGAALNVSATKVKLQRALASPLPGLPYSGELGSVYLESDRKYDAGLTLGAQALAGENLKIGLVFRTAYAADLTAPAVFTWNAIHTGNLHEDSLIVSQLPKNQDASTTIHFPTLLMGGLEYAVTPRLKVEADVDWSRWSTVDTLVIDFADTPSLQSRTPLLFKNAVAVRAGFEYDLWEPAAGSADALKLRGGAYYDQSPQPSSTLNPILSDTDRWGLSAGLGYAQGSVKVDAYALLVMFANRSTEQASVLGLDGTWKPRAFIVGLGLGVAL